MKFDNPAVWDYRVSTNFPRQISRIMPGSGKYYVLDTDYENFAILWSCSNLGFIHSGNMLHHRRACFLDFGNAHFLQIDLVHNSQKLFHNYREYGFFWIREYARAFEKVEGKTLGSFMSLRRSSLFSSPQPLLEIRKYTPPPLKRYVEKPWILVKFGALPLYISCGT